MNSYRNNKTKLSVNDIKKNFKDLPVLDDITLDLKEKEFVSIIGPSGSGKTTLFNIIAGLLMPDSGEVIIDNEDCTGKTGKISYMHQKDLLLPWKKTLDNIALPLIIRGEGIAQARNKVQAYLELFGLEEFQDKYPFQLSGGMRQRAALLRTYMFSADIMLLDEPFGGLDAITKAKMHFWLLSVMKKLQSSVLMITHDIEEAILLSNRIYVLDDRPARIREEVFIELPEERNKDTLTSLQFTEIKKHILNILQ